MNQKQLSVNCACFTNGKCTHHAAPKRWFSAATCILVEPSSDPRVPSGCDLQVHYPRPTTKIVPPPTKP
jgi:hypothetical protein